MTIFATRLAGVEQLAEGTMAFHLERPEGFDYQPGQAVDLQLVENTGGQVLQDVSHTFSLVSAPHETQLTLATRMRDSQYKNSLGSLATGSSLWLDGPFGTALVPDATERPLVLIAGGIGITPFISILHDAAHRQLQRPLRLLYSNRRPEDTAFLAELQELERSYPAFKMLATMTDMSKSAQDWTGPTSYLDAQSISKFCQDLENPLYFLSGPPALVEAMYDVLEDADVDEDDISSEGFTGY